MDKWIWLCYSESSSFLYILSPVSACCGSPRFHPAVVRWSLLSDANRRHNLSHSLLLFSRSGNQRKWIHRPPVSLLLFHCFQFFSLFCLLPLSLSFLLPFLFYVLSLLRLDYYSAETISLLKWIDSVTWTLAGSDFSNMTICCFCYCELNIFEDLDGWPKKRSSFEDVTFVLTFVTFCRPITNWLKKVINNESNCYLQA